MSIDLPPAQRKMAKGTLFGYRIRKHIGDGAWSRVYEVEDTKTHTAYALKHVVSEGEKQDRYLDQLRAEWEIGSKLDHPAMRKLVALEHQGTWLARNSRDLGLVMELIDAQPLSEQRRPSMPECLQIFRDVAGALMHMHAKGFVNADMKPLNILYTDDRRTKVIDLGQAAKIGTQKVRLQGSPGFIAPEQATETRSPKTEKPPRGGDKAKESKLYEPVTELTDVSTSRPRCTGSSCGSTPLRPSTRRPRSRSSFRPSALGQRRRSTSRTARSRRCCRCSSRIRSSGSPRGGSR